VKKYYLLVILAAIFAAVNVPFSKYLLPNVPLFLMVGMANVGGMTGLGALFGISLLSKKEKSPLIHGIDWLYMGLINTFDCFGSVLLFTGINLLSGETASLLQSFEIVTTALVALIFLKEKISWRLWTAIGTILVGAVFLSFDPATGFSFNPGALCILGTTVLWGFNNTLAKKLSKNNPLEFSFLKCLVPAVVLTSLGLILGERCGDVTNMSLACLDGFLAFGLSMALLTLSFRHLSASLGTALFALNPFLGAIFSLIAFPEWPAWSFYVAIVLVVAGEILAGYDGVLSSRKLARENPS
jgi:drug/metabolite transporter (DMT)-like permease